MSPRSWRRRFGWAMILVVLLIIGGLAVLLRRIGLGELAVVAAVFIAAIVAHGVGLFVRRFRQGYRGKD